MHRPRTFSECQAFAACFAATLVGSGVLCTCMHWLECDVSLGRRWPLRRARLFLLSHAGKLPFDRTRNTECAQCRPEARRAWGSA